MKISIDIASKEISISQDILVGEFVWQLQQIFPDGAWKDYKIVQSSVKSVTHTICKVDKKEAIITTT